MKACLGVRTETVWPTALPLYTPQALPVVPENDLPFLLQNIRTYF